jgi:uncharacterized protein (DUF488 family)
MSAALFTVGYQGRSISEFVELLRHHRITRVIDVRELPLSRRRGFSKTPLRSALEAAKIDYFHLRQAGNPYRDRRNDPEKCLALYRKHLDAHPEVLVSVEEAATGHRAALLCVESDPSCCHRSIIAEGMKRQRRSSAIQNI